MRLILLLCLLLQGCAVIATHIGASAATVQTATVADSIKLSADVGSEITTGQTLNDHALSLATGKQCKVWNIFSGKAICRIHKRYDRIDYMATPS
jgi:hypothetical protein